ncbi:MAG: pyruvate formate lyase family protein, partial [Nitrososphaeria archaeon]
QAKAFAHVLDNIPIWIDENELIVGHGASEPGGVELDPFLGIWKIEDIKGVEEEGLITVDEKDLPKINEMAKFWKTKNIQYRAQFAWTDSLFNFMKVGISLPPMRSKDEERGAYAGSGLAIYSGLHLTVLDYEKLLNLGLMHFIKEAEAELENLRLFTRDDIEKKNFLEAVIISLNAIIRFANRYAKLAEEMASKEKDPIRKKELERIAETCKWVPANPARTFYEAIQSFWFIYLVCNPSPTIGMGRFDQYMYPFYKRDKEAGRITDEEVLALLCELRIKDMELVRIALRPIKRQQQAGIAKWHNMIIGGVTPDGKDATNELTYLILEAAKIVRTPHHTITLRVHENTPEDLIIKALEVVKLGLGMPAFIGDKSYIEFLTSLGVPLEIARDYAIGGCLDVAIPGKARLGAAPFFVVPKVLEIFLNDGIDPRTGVMVKPLDKDLTEIKSFEEFLSSFKQYLAYSISRVIEGQNTLWYFHQDTFKHVVEAVLMDEGIDIGKGLLERKMPYDFDATLLAVGMINVVDSLAAIKKLVFDEKKITLKQLKEALAANWQGYEEIRKMCLEAPKYGNDDDYVDSIAVDLYNFYADEVYKYNYTNGERWVPGGISISSMWAGGAITGATPDGRFAGEVLADGSMSPMRGRDINGPTAVIRSASKINQSRFASTLLNMKFHPSSLSSTEDLRKLAFLIKTYFKLGGKHIQFNVVSRETLIEAQKHPENYRDLVVRVAGYSAYFVELAKSIQDEIIKRTEHLLDS